MRWLEQAMQQLLADHFAWIYEKKFKVYQHQPHCATKDAVLYLSV